MSRPSQKTMRNPMPANPIPAKRTPTKRTPTNRVPANRVPANRGRAGTQTDAPATAPIDRQAFLALAEAVCRLPATAATDARVLLWISAEQSTFIRFNRSQPRQLTLVEQCKATLTVVADGRRLAMTLTLAPLLDAATLASETQRLSALRDSLFDDLRQAPHDPLLHLPDTQVDTEREEVAALPSPERIVSDVVSACAQRRQPDGQALDLVGFYAGGPCIRAFADSRGQHNWHRVDTFLFEWSLYSSANPEVRDRAVKARYAGTRWDRATFEQRLDASVALLTPLALPDRVIAPGRYRALLMPEAVAELLGAMAWGGFGLRDRRTGTSVLSRFADGKAQFAPGVTLTESVATGLAPCFTDDGLILADRVPLIHAGQLPPADDAQRQAGAAGALVGPRSAVEYQTTPNSSDQEFPVSLHLAGGQLPMTEAIARLDHGILIGNLWYLNFSDRNRGRVTGMTRFASFLVENGEVVAPIGVMRFDDSLFDLFGDRLDALTAHPEFLPGGDTWGSRVLSSTACPGLLVNGIELTL